MLIDFNFRHFQPSDELVAHVSDQLHKLMKLDRKSVRASVVFSSQKKTKRIDVTLTGDGLHLHARGEAEDFFGCIDLASERLYRQFEKAQGRPKAARRRAG